MVGLRFMVTEVLITFFCKNKIIAGSKKPEAYSVFIAVCGLRWRDSSVGIASGYGLDDRGFRV
jgi:hypothetical protein